MSSGSSSRVARRDLLIAFAAALLFITSRFSYYNVFQVMGTMEALGMLLLVLILYASVTYVRRHARWPGFVLVGLFLLISLTHERYLALFPFLVLLVILKGRSSWRVRAFELALLCVPPVLNVVLKRFVFATSVMMGTGGQELGFDPAGILKFLIEGRRQHGLGQLGAGLPERHHHVGDGQASRAWSSS